MLNKLFESTPGTAFKYYTLMAILSGVLIVGGMAFNYIYNKKKKNNLAFKKVFKKLGSKMVMFGILFLILMMVRYETIPYFSMRIWLYLSILALLIIVGLYLKRWKKDYTKMHIELMEKEAKKANSKNKNNSYSPKKHRKKHKK